MERKLFAYIWRNSWRDQLIVLAIVVVAQIFYFVSLDLPKRIVNNAIQGEAFDGNPTAKFLRIVIDPIDTLGTPEIVLFGGIDLERLPYLIALCLAFLFFVVINGWLKQQVNVEKGRLGERMLRRIRYELVDRVLRFPIGYFRKLKQAEIATMIKDEVEPLGGFIGDAYIQPAFLGGQAITALFFIIVQSTWLGLVTILILGIQLVIIPKMRIRVLALGKERQLTARQLAGRIAEISDGAVVIHTNDTSNFERADIVARLERIFLIRFELYQRKFLVKYINNMLAQTTPFLFYLIGGWLALTGRFDVGSLIAAIGAYKDLPGPIKELIDWDQQRQDVQIKYDQVIEQFSPTQMLSPDRQRIDEDPSLELTKDGFTLRSAATTDDSGTPLLEDITIDIGETEHWAIIGINGAGTHALGPVLAGLVQLSSGNARLGGKDIANLPESITGRAMAYVEEETFLLPLSLLDNILYVFRHRPIAPARYEGRSLQHFHHRMSEARKSGNPEIDINADWIDYQEAGLQRREELVARIAELLPLFEIEDDIYYFGLRGRIDAAREPILADKFLKARSALIERLKNADSAGAGLVEIFDPARYNRNMTVAENILFGTAKGPIFTADSLRDNRIFAQAIESAGLSLILAQMGSKIAETMIELFADLPPGHPFFEQFSFIAADDLPGYQQILSRVQKSGLESAALDDRKRLVALTFPYIEARHRLSLIDAEMESKLLDARRTFASRLPEDMRDAVEFYDPLRYNSSASVQDNILFGRLVYGQAQAQQKIMKLIVEIIDDLDLKFAILSVGLDYNAGAGGKRLNAAQRQKIALLRAILRNPRFLILNHALAPLEAASQPRIAANIRKIMAGKGLIAITTNRDLLPAFDRAAIMKDGRIVEKGSPDILNREGGILRPPAAPKV